MGPQMWTDHMQRTSVLHWDGRLDNRNELLLLLVDSLRDDTSNSALALAVYERWGTNGFVHRLRHFPREIELNAPRLGVTIADNSKLCADMRTVLRDATCPNRGMLINRTGRVT